MSVDLPLKGVLVLEFCQYLAGPWAGLRLADLGADVVKIERPGTGDACRQLKTRNIEVDGDSLVFHTVNRNKTSIAANLKDPADQERVRDLVAKADVVTHNFRPGVMEKLGLDYDNACKLNPSLVYAHVTGYGNEGPWRAKPGQDLLAQALSGLMHLTGKHDDPPVPMGMAVADGICGLHLAQGITAALLRRARTGAGALVEVSLLESLIDLQFEALTTHLNDGHRPPRRSSMLAGHPYQGAPYGIYPTADGHLALAMGKLDVLDDVLGLGWDAGQLEPPGSFIQADMLRGELLGVLATKPTGHWLDVLGKRGVWCGPVLDYEALRTHPAYEALQVEQTVERAGASVATLRCPVRIDGQRLFDAKAAPKIDDGGAEVADAHKPTPTGDTTPALPLAGMRVIELAQFLSGPSAGLRLADLGAEVIKIEQPGSGDICRTLYVSDTVIDGDSTIFHAINRNKAGVQLDLKSEAGRAEFDKLLASADVLLHNFRPGVMDRLGLDDDTLARQHPKLIRGEITGYGHDGPLRDWPGQDLLLQAVSGMALLSGNADDGPVPMGLAVVDLWAGALLCHGVLAALLRRERTSFGGLVQVNMFEAALDFQFEPITMHLHDGSLPERTASNNAHTLVAAPYGVYETADGHLALAMADIRVLAELLECPPLAKFDDPDRWFADRDAIKAVIAEHLKTKPTTVWTDVLDAADIWCAGVLDWHTLLQHDGFKVLDVLQTVRRTTGTEYRTTCCPIKLNGTRLKSPRGSCGLGEQKVADFIGGA
ncbi:MAG: CoA transferase [Planctomycetota bacterium]